MRENRLKLGIAGSAVILAAVMVLAYRNANRAVGAGHWVSHTYEVIAELESAFSGLKNAESGVRYFEVTGREEFSKPYHDAVQETDRSLTRLRALVADNSQQEQRLSALLSERKARMAELDALVEVRRRRGFEAARRMTASTGFARMEYARRLIDEMQSEEKRLLEVRLNDERDAARQTVLSISALCILAITVFALLIARITRDNIALTVEIAERRKAQQALDRYARFFSLSVDMFCIADFDGYFKELSDSWEIVLGHPKEEMLKIPYLDFIHPEDRQRTSEESSENSAGTSTLSFENRYRCKDGSYKWLLWNAKPISAERLIYAVARDITERKQDEQALQDYAGKLEKANAELDAFSYSVSHDLRAPLRAIDGFAKILEEDYAPRLDDEGRRLLGVVCNNARQMGRLIDELLAFSRLGRKKLEKTTVDMDALADSVVEQQKSMEPKRTIAVERKTLPAAHGDPALLQQVMANLVSNAFKFTRQKPDARVEIGFTEDAYFVKDNGAGFDMRYSNKLFGVFSRLHGADEFEGTGVGLALVQRIVSRHGGRIWADARPGEGATFRFTLPKSGGDNA